MKYNPEIHHRRSIRLKGYDYSQNGAYFITLCAQNKECLFGEIVGAGSKPAQMILNDTGKIIEYTWNDLPNHNHNIELDEFIIMPNHIHGIVIITKDETIVGAVRAGSKPALTAETATIDTRAGLERAGLEPAPTGDGLSEIVRQFKTFSAKRINKLCKTHAIAVWQRNYYEHIIRNEQSLQEIRGYIINNSYMWKQDELFCKTI